MSCLCPRVAIFGAKYTVPPVAVKDFLVVFSEVSPDLNVNDVMVLHRPDVLITIGMSWMSFKGFSELAFQLRKCWLHFNNTEEITSWKIMNCYLYNHEIISPDEPLITVFSTSFKSGDKILRPLRSLQAQTYRNWEWIIVDDSDDNGENFIMLQELTQRDYRIKAFKPDRHTGYIGAGKRHAAMLGNGELLAEVDHDDDLTPDCFELLRQAYLKFPDAGFFYTDFCELFEKNNGPFEYGGVFGFGYSGYIREWHGQKISRCFTPKLNGKTLSYIVGVPNHLRVWTRNAYLTLNGHNPSLPIVDDYELILRTFLHYRFVYIPRMCYLQYRNEGGNNFTFLRNAEIQKMTRWISSKYQSQISLRLKELKVIDNRTTRSSHEKEWERDPLVIEPGAELLFIPDPNEISIVIPTYNRPKLLKRAIESVLTQTYTNWKLLIIGDKCPTLRETMSQYQDRRIAWYNLKTNHGAGGAVPRNYALKLCAVTELIAYLDDDNYWLPTHLETCMATIDEKTQYVFSSFKMEEYTIICREPKRMRIDTSCILFRRGLLDRHGYWQDRLKACYWHDWEIVSRWVKANEPYKPTLQTTLMYNTDTNGQNGKQIYLAYPDQPPLQNIS